MRQLHFYLYQEGATTGIGLMHRDWPVVLALLNQKVASAISPLVSGDPAMADFYLEVPLSRGDLVSVLGVVPEAHDRNVAGDAGKAAALDRVVTAEVVRESTADSVVSGAAKRS